MNYKILAVVLILVAVGSGIYYFQNNITVSPEDQRITNELIKEELTIVYNNDGFYPQEITIRKGDTIRFINQSDRKMWVASDNHPAHDIYPEFDQKDISLRGTEYKFKFDKTGTWGFHNHMFSSHVGKIIVE